VETSDKQFILTFIGVSGVLVLVAVTVLVAANLVGSRSYEKSAAQIRIAEERIEPVGKVNLKSAPVRPAESPAVAAAEPQAPAGAQAQAAGGQDVGQRVYGGLCQSCHQAGVMGAPMFGNADAWKPRIAQGIDVLYQSALHGKNLMPPKGGNPALSDEEVKAAVDYMVDAASQ
jgi:cytochrome c5